jgi:hypothetical protein
MSEQFEKDLKRLEVLKEQLENDGFKCLKVIEGRGICGLNIFIFTIGLCFNIDSFGWGGRYCYPHADAMDAFMAITAWDGKEDPLGKWIKYKGRDGEYSNPKLIEVNL